MRKDVFDSPEFKEFSRDFDAGMKACDKAPPMNCPVCGNRMGLVMGRGTFDGYQCSGWDCVGIRLTHEDLIDSERFKYACDEAKSRHTAREEMRKRNGFTKHSRLDGDEFESLAANFRKRHGLTKDEAPMALYNDKALQSKWVTEYTAKTPAWCGTCHGYHLPTKEHPMHSLCGGLHAPMPKDIFFDYRGWKFTPPFICMGCGIEVCFRQWAFSRSCGSCDVSQSTTRRLLYRKCFSGPHVKLSTWSAKESDIEESLFVDPGKRLEYPILPKQVPFTPPPQRMRRR
jgi:hypothetical protein